jgi:hypothetical protein
MPNQLLAQMGRSFSLSYGMVPLWELMSYFATYIPQVRDFPKHFSSSSLRVIPENLMPALSAEGEID